MIIYNTTWLNNLLIVNAVREDFNEGFVPENEWKAVQEVYRYDFYSPNLFMRVGLFFLTVITCAFSSGLFSLMLASNGVMVKFGWPLFLAVLHYIALEYVVRDKHHYRSGVDDALLWISFGLVTIAFVMATNAGDHPLLLSCFVLVLSGILSLRFTDALMSLVCYGALLAVVFFGWQKIGPLGNATMPFVMMIISAGIYWLVRKNLDVVVTRFYAGSMMVLQVAALLSLYAAGNYFVVKELNDLLNGTLSKSIPFGWLFWSWTVFMPMVYILIGLKQKNSILLRTGLLLVAAAAGTYKTYYKLMPLEYTFIICGTIALILSYLVTRFLNRPRNGFTCKELKKEYLMEELKLESLVVSELGDRTAPIVEAGVELGGGRFGGGGSTGNF